MLLVKTILMMMEPWDFIKAKQVSNMETNPSEQVGQEWQQSNVI